MNPALIHHIHISCCLSIHLYDGASKVCQIAIRCTTLQSIMNAKLNQHRFRPCHESGLINTILMIPHNLHVSFKLTSLYCGLRIILVYPNPQ